MTRLNLILLLIYNALHVELAHAVKDARFVLAEYRQHDLFIIPFGGLKLLNLGLGQLYLWFNREVLVLDGQGICEPVIVVLCLHAHQLLLDRMEWSLLAFRRRSNVTA